ncbi:hypothetical protein [Streptacidiphilus fuscans]|uniref:Uncharacterized protein n=1 Tax=Streptacidiphilus fuscans TaxID=2789292 RepID=A0A931B5X2_9ACTN|nr:hypothetical protein [Streptacidiphilus fuscans]MBF9070843.1 hypothetical protein [Streptacidiphilus fuscans]
MTTTDPDELHQPETEPETEPQPEAEVADAKAPAEPDVAQTEQPADAPTAPHPQPPAPTPPPALHPGVAAPLPLPQPLPQPLPATAWALPAELAPKPRKERPWLRTLARWSSATAVLLVAGAVTAALVTVPARTDLPGLRTPADGRWTFPALSLPELPSGAPAPAGNGHVHSVDLRELLVPAPDGASPDATLPGRNGWYPTASFLKLYTTSASLLGAFDDAGLRHIAATGWSMPDGTHTQIYLQQFRSNSTASNVDSAEADGVYLTSAADAQDATGVDLGSITATVRSLDAGGGHGAVIYAYLTVGDTEALIEMTNPRQIPTVDFRQVVELQNQLLSA